MCVSLRSDIHGEYIHYLISLSECFETSIAYTSLRAHSHLLRVRYLLLPCCESDMKASMGRSAVLIGSQNCKHGKATLL